MQYIPEIPPPRDEQVFEDLCRRLWSRIWDDPDARKHGRRGQSQQGVDIFGRRPDGGWEGVQCKKKAPGQRLTRGEIETEIEKARGFAGLTRLIIATTAPRDNVTQGLERELTEEEERRGSFSVVVYCWEDVSEKLWSFEDLRRDVVGVTGHRHEDQAGVLPVPEPPPHYLFRPEHLEPVKQALLSGESPKLGLTGHGKVGLQGMGGIGKTVLAAAVARDPEVAAAFPDGVLWVTLGQHPSLLEIQQELAFDVCEPKTVLRSEPHGKRALKRALATSRILLVLDDVWVLRHASMLDVVGDAGRLLITTRNREVLAGLGAEEHRIELLSREQARVLLADWAGMSADELPTIAEDVARECGHLPLALSMIGAMARLEPTAWEDALTRLRRADLDRIRQDFPNYPYPDLLRALEVSVQALDARDLARYLELAVFPEDLAIPKNAVEVLWSPHLPAVDARDLLRRLAARALLHREQELVSVHDLQGDYLRSRTRDPEELHSKLVVAYRERCRDGFASGSDDGYFFGWLGHHLVGAGRMEELKRLLVDGRWLAAKLRHTNVTALLFDFDHLPPGDALGQVANAIRLSAHVLTRAPEELASQLHGRLEGPRELLDSAASGMTSAWLQPLTRSLEAPGGPLLRTLKGHSTTVRRVAALGDDRLISASEDGTLRLWAPDSGEVIATLEGHSGTVSGILALRDGRVVFTSDGTLQLWDPTSGEVILLEDRADDCSGIVMLDDGRVVSAGSDTLQVWDPDSEEGIPALDGDAHWVRNLAVLADGRVVASSGRALRVWDPDSGAALMTLKGHTDRVTRVAVLGDGRVVSAGYETLRVWDPNTGDALAVLRNREENDVLCLAVVGDDLVVFGSQNGVLCIWDPATDRVIASHRGHAYAVMDVAIMGDGRVASVAGDGTPLHLGSQLGRGDHSRGPLGLGLRCRGAGR